MLLKILWPIYLAALEAMNIALNALEDCLKQMDENAVRDFITGLDEEERAELESVYADIMHDDEEDEVSAEATPAAETAPVEATPAEAPAAEETVTAPEGPAVVEEAPAAEEKKDEELKPVEEQPAPPAAAETAPVEATPAPVVDGGEDTAGPGA